MVERHIDPESLVPYSVPVVLIVGATLAFFFIPDPFQVLLPLAMFACGYVLRPARLWPIWLAAWLGLAAIFGVLVLLGFEPPKTPEEDLPITLGSFLFSAGMFGVELAVLALGPLWLGRYVANRRMQVTT